MQLWIVGQWREAALWEFGGVFDSEERAIAACRDATYFIAPYMLNVPATHETTPMVGSYYPLLENAADAVQRKVSA